MNGPAPSLSVVMPVYNEAENIAGVIGAWSSELDRLGISYELRVYDDGSRDATDAILQSLAATMPRLRVGRHDNRGHGQTVLRGYYEASGEWIFQIDSDDELDVAAFHELWARREDHDFLLGLRVGRQAAIPRRIVTWGSRLMVRMLFGPGVGDANVPYRLMRASALRRLLPDVPADAFAPNVILSGLAVYHRLRVFEVPVRHRGRRHGRSSLGALTIVRPAARALWQTLQAARRARRGPGA